MQLLVLLVLIIVTFFAIRPIQQFVDSKTDLLKKRTINYLENRINLRITYESISPSVFSFVEIRKLAVYNKTDPEKISLYIERLRVFYKIEKLFSSDRTVSLRELRIRNSDIFLDIDEESGAFEFIRNSLLNSTQSEPIAVIGKNISMSLHSAHGRFKADNLFFSVKNVNSTFFLDFRGQVEMKLTKKYGRFETLSTKLNVNGRLDQQLRWSDVRVSFSRFSSNIFTLDKQTFHLSIRNNTLEIWKIKDDLPINIKISFNPEKGMLEFAFAAENFTPNSLVQPKQELSQIKPWLSTELSGEGRVLYNIKTNSMSYQGTINAAVDNIAVPFPFTCKTIFEGGVKSVNVQALRLQSEYGDFRFHGSISLETFYPTGWIYAKDVPYLTGEKLQATLYVEPDQEKMKIWSNYIQIGDIVFEETYATILPYQKSYDFFLETHITGKEPGTLTIEGNFQQEPDIFIQAGITTRRMGIEQITNLVLPKTVEIPPSLSFINQQLITAEIFLNTDLKQFAFACPQIVLQDPESPENTISFGLAGNNNSIEFHEVQVSWNEYQAGGYITSSFLANGEIMFSSSFHLEGIPYSLYGFYVPNKSLTVNGDYGLNFSLHRYRKEYVFSFNTENLPIPIGDNVASATLHFQGIIQDVNRFEIQSKKSTINDLPIFSGINNSVSFSAAITSETVTVYNFLYSDSTSDLLGNGEFHYVFLKDKKTAEGWLQLKSEKTDEAYNAIFSYDDKDLTAGITYESSPLERFQNIPVTGLLSGEMEITGNIESPNISIQTTLLNGQLNNDPFTFDLTGSLSQSEINVENLEFRYLSNRLYDFNGFYNFKTGEYTFNSSFTGNFQSQQLRTSITLKGRTSTIESREEILQIVEHDFSGNLTINEISFGDQIVDGWDIAFEQDSTLIAFSGGPENSFQGYIDRNGEFTLNLIDPSPVVLEAKGVLQQANINANLDISSFDIEALNTFLNIPLFNLRKGLAYGEVSIRGPVNDPDFFGELTVRDGIAKNRIIPADLGPFDASLLFDGKEFTIPKVTIPVETATASVNVDLVMDHWIPRTYDITIISLGSGQIPVQTNFAQVQVNGYASGKLRLKGDFSGVEINGNLKASQTTITIGEKPEYKNRKFQYSVDITVTSGRGVQFLWPTNDFPIIRTNLDTDEELSVKYNNNTGEMKIVGDLEMRGGQIYYFSRSFFLKEGSIVFNENQDKFDPILNARAEIREVAPEGEDVRIYLVAENTPLSQFTPRFESVPSLSNAEIFSILGQSMATDISGEEARLSSTLVHTGGYLISQLRFVRSFEEKVKQILKLDLFTIRTQMIENLVLAGVFGEEVSTLPTTPIGTFGRYLDNTTVFLGKYLSEDLFLEAMLSLQVNDPLTEENKTEEDFTVETEISVEWKTPLALLELTFMPNLQDLFGEPPGVSLALSWGFSF